LTLQKLPLILIIYNAEERLDLQNKTAATEVNRIIFSRK